MKTMDRREFMGVIGITLGAALVGGCALKKPTQTSEPIEPTQTVTNTPAQSLPKIDLTNRYIAYCGNNCERCPQYKKECQAGCLGETCSSGCGACSVRKCAIRTQVENCAECNQYPCKTLQTQYENMDAEGYGSWAKTAKLVLENIRLAQQ